MKQQKTASVLVYVLILVNVALVIGYMIFSNTERLNNSISTATIAADIEQKLEEKALLSKKSVEYYNHNGGGFTDQIGCPKKITVQSEQTEESESDQSEGNISEEFSSILKKNAEWKPICEFFYNNQKAEIRFNSDFTQFENIFIDNRELAIYQNNGIFQVNMWDKRIKLEEFWPDRLDDNLNDDNGSKYIFLQGENQKYPWITDDDADFVKNIFWNIQSGKTENIFTIDSKILQKLKKNNYDFPSLESVQKPTFTIEILWEHENYDYTIKVLTFDKNMKFIRTELTQTINSKVGTLHFSKNLNYETYDYAFFIKNNSTNTYSYKIFATDTEWNSLAINPIAIKNKEIEVYVSHIFQNAGTYKKYDDIFRFPTELTVSQSVEN